MIYLAIIVGCILGAIFGMNAPIISYTYSTYLAIAVVAALDSVFGGITSVLKKTFDLKIFLSGFFVNSILSILLTILGQKLNVDIYLATLFVFVIEMVLTSRPARRSMSTGTIPSPSSKPSAKNTAIMSKLYNNKQRQYYDII